MLVVALLSLNIFSCQSDSDDEGSEQNSFSLVSISPTANSTVDASTTLTAEIEYSIADFDTTKTYAVFIWFKRTDTGSKFNDTTNGVEPITSASGSVTHVYPISVDLADPYIKQPLELMYALHSYSPSGPQPGDVGFDFDGSYITSTTIVTYQVK
jgi:hypothetical protein